MTEPVSPRFFRGIKRIRDSLEGRPFTRGMIRFALAAGAIGAAMVGQHIFDQQASLVITQHLDDFYVTDNNLPPVNLGPPLLWYAMAIVLFLIAFGIGPEISHLNLEIWRPTMQKLAAR